MLRRAFITGLILGLPTIASARSFIKDTECIGKMPCIERGNMVYIQNKIGLTVSYTREISADLYSMYRMDAKKIYQNMYGTSFSISKKNVKYKNKLWLKFTRVSNDTRDKPYVWYQISNKLY